MFQNNADLYLRINNYELEQRILEKVKNTLTTTSRTDQGVTEELRWEVVKLKGEVERLGRELEGLKKLVYKD